MLFSIVKQDNFNCKYTLQMIRSCNLAKWTIEIFNTEGNIDCIDLNLNGNLKHKINPIISTM